MQVITSSTLTVLHDGQFWVGICERTDEGSYGACRVVFGATEPADTEILAFVCERWASLPFVNVEDEAVQTASAHANPKRRQREARKLVERAGVGTKAQQAMSAASRSARPSGKRTSVKRARRPPNDGSPSSSRNARPSIAAAEAVLGDLLLDGRCSGA